MTPFCIINNIILVFSYIFNIACKSYNFCKYVRFFEYMISYEPLFRTMKEKGISSYRLNKMGFSRSTYYAIKQGQSISTNTLNILCRLLQCPVSDIIEYIDKD